MREGWTYKKLGEICSFIGGGTPSKNVGKYYCGDIPWASVRDMGNFKLSTTEFKITQDAVKNSATNILPKGMIIISTHVGLGKICELMQDTAINQDLKGVDLDTEVIDKYYFCYWYKSKEDYILSNATGATVKGVTLKFVQGMDVVLPPISTQHLIVSELDLLCHIINQKRQQLKEYDALAESIFYDMFGDPVENPNGWELKKLNEVCDYIVDGDHMPPPKSETGIPFITISNVDKENKAIDFSSTYYVPQNYYDNLKEDHKPKVGDVLYTVTGSYGIPILVEDDKPFCFQRHIGLLHPNKELNSVFLLGWAGSNDAKRQADDAATGIAQKTVSLKSLRQFVIPLPPFELQCQFADKIQSIEQQKQLLRESIKETETLFQSRMDYWFNS